VTVSSSGESSTNRYSSPDRGTTPTILSKSRCVRMRARVRQRLDHAGGVECLDPRTNDHGSASHTIVTTEPNELCAELHNRMPVILPSEAWPAWLGEEPADVPQLKALLAPYPSTSGFERSRIRGADYRAYRCNDAPRDLWPRQRPPSIRAQRQSGVR